jgi:hypothetical protein
MSTASKADRMKMPEWQFGDPERRLFPLTDQQSLDLLLSRLTMREYSGAYKGRVVARAIQAAQRMNLRMPKWATDKVLAEAASVSAFTDSVPDITDTEQVTFSGGAPAADPETVRGEAESQARDYAAARNRGRNNVERGLEVASYDDVDRERLDRFITRHNERVKKD